MERSGPVEPGLRSPDMTHLRTPKATEPYELPRPREHSPCWKALWAPRPVPAAKAPKTWPQQSLGIQMSERGPSSTREADGTEQGCLVPWAVLPRQRRAHTWHWQEEGRTTSTGKPDPSLSLPVELSPPFLVELKPSMQQTMFYAGLCCRSLRCQGWAPHHPVGLGDS